MRKIKVAIAFSFVAAVIGALAAEALGYPPMLAKARKFGAKDCTFCHIDPAGGPPWNERGQWLIDEKERRKADAVDVEWLKEYKPGQGKKNEDKSTASSGSGGIEQELLKLEREWLDAYLNRDVAAMERIEADDFTITHPNGQVLTKADEIASLKKNTGPKDPSLSFSTEETKVRVFGDTAILTGIVVTRQKDSVERARYTDVYVKRNGRWQVVSSHLTGLRPPPAAPQPAPPAQPTATTSPAKVDPKIYDDYIGQYETPFGPLNIMKEGDKLFGQPEGDSKEELVPESETVFNVARVGAKVTFVKDASGKVTHMVVNMQGQNIQAKKVK